MAIQDTSTNGRDRGKWNDWKRLGNGCARGRGVVWTIGNYSKHKTEKPARPPKTPKKRRRANSAPLRVQVSPVRGEGGALAETQRQRATMQQGRRNHATADRPHVVSAAGWRLGVGRVSVGANSATGRSRASSANGGRWRFWQALRLSFRKLFSQIVSNRVA